MNLGEPAARAVSCSKVDDTAGEEGSKARRTLRLRQSRRTSAPRKSPAPRRSQRPGSRRTARSGQPGSRGASGSWRRSSQRSGQSLRPTSSPKRARSRCARRRPRDRCHVRLRPGLLGSVSDPGQGTLALRPKRPAVVWRLAKGSRGGVSVDGLSRTSRARCNALEHERPSGSDRGSPACHALRDVPPTRTTYSREWVQPWSRRTAAAHLGVGTQTGHATHGGPRQAPATPGADLAG
jgi:hypothetical protein